MKKTDIKSSVLVIALSFFFLNANAQNYFQTSWWGVSNSFPACNDIIETSDGYIVGVGDAEAVSGNTKKCVVMKLDDTGDTLWTRTMHDDIEFGKQILETIDNNYLVLGDVWGLFPKRHTGLIKLTPDGDIIWNRRYGLTTNPYYPFSMVEASDGSIYVTGSDGFGSGVFILKLTPDGMIIWNKSFDLPSPVSYVNVKEIHMTQDGGIVIMAHTKNGVSPGIPTDDLILAKMDSSGTVVWSKMIPAHSEWEYGGMIPTYDGGYVITSMTDLYGPVAGDHMMVLKTDALGDVQWTTVLGKNFDLTFVYDILENSNHDILISGKSANVGILTKLSENGNHIRTKEYDFNIGNVEINSIIESSDLGLIYGGKIDLGKWYVFKGDSTGISGCGNEGTKFNFVVENPMDTSFDITFSTNTHAFMDTGYAFISSDEYTLFYEDTICLVLGVKSEQQGLKHKLEVYPNPNSGLFTIEFNNWESENLELRILNTLGQVVYTQSFSGFNGSFRTSLDLSAQPAGVYNIQLTTDKHVILRRVVVE